jgi:hypothetical protein
MIEWLNKWIGPSTVPVEVRIQTYGYTDRTVEKCWCGGGLITFYSRNERVCISDKCGRKYDLHNGVEIKHQR